jgi:hypothetical protein
VSDNLRRLLKLEKFLVDYLSDYPDSQSIKEQLESLRVVISRLKENGWEDKA